MTMFLRSFLRGPNLLGTGSPGGIFKGRRKQRLEVSLPRKDASGVGPCDEPLISVEQSLLQGNTSVRLIYRFLLADTSSLQEMGQKRFLS